MFSVRGKRNEGRPGSPALESGDKLSRRVKSRSIDLRRIPPWLDMATIKPIEGRSIHQIQSGQVIVDLCSVVKELVENSLDANATSIDVRFKNQGLDLIEVQDNGDGISPENYETIALKHYTSKLASYEDLSSLQTFGFRGEALSSLCALSSFHVRTAQGKDGSKGTRLDFEASGKLKATSVIASQKGTTVAVEDIFRNLPVRRKELEKNVKREYGKVVNLLHAYACISVGARFAVSNQMAKNKKTTVFSTKPNSTTKENIANIYGAKTSSALVPLNLILELEPSNRPTPGARTRSIQDDEDSREVQVLGHISRPVSGEGRQTPDRQMFFVNSRPCALPQVAKAFNEVYKSFNVSQSPFIFANIKLDTNAYDINVSPDKRTILLHDQATLLENLKISLTNLFESHDQSVPLSHFPARNTPAFKSTIAKPVTAIDLSPEISPERGSANDGESETNTTQPTESSSMGSWSTLNDQPVSLVEKFAKRNANSQTEPFGLRASTAVPSKEKGNPAKDVVSHVADRTSNIQISRRESTNVDQSNERSIDEAIVNSPESLAEKSTEPTRVPNAVEDFNDRMAVQQAKRRKVAVAETDPFSEGEEPIPSLPNSSQRVSPGPVQNAFDRMRPTRKTAEEATITIGDVTTTMTIGPSSSAKRQRSHYIKEPTQKSSPAIRFSKSLRAFSAPGTQADAEEEIEDDSAAEDLGVTRVESHASRPETDSDATFETGSAAGPDIESEEEVEEQENEQHVQQNRRNRRSTEFDEEDKSLFRLEPQDLVEGAGGDIFNADSPGSEALPVASAFDDASDEDYVDETGKKAREDAKVEQLIHEAEEAAAQPTGDNLKRVALALKGRSQKSSTLSLIRSLEITVGRIDRQQTQLTASLESLDKQLHEKATADDDVASKSAEERLSLTVSKSDFDHMIVVGQFNLGFIVAMRPSTTVDTSDELFIIDQHASDEKFNFERLQRTTVVQNQRLVHPLHLELTAIDEETILEHPDALARNGFLVEVDTEAEELPMGRRTKLLGLPISREVTFTLGDLEELLVLLREWHGSTSTTQSTDAKPSNAFDALRRANSNPDDGVEIPRPDKVRKMFAMRACRGSIMIGRTLTHAQMQRVVRHLGGLDKPWNCPHGRPTMRHLASLREWKGWREGDGLQGFGQATSGPTDWTSYLKSKREKPSQKSRIVYGATGSEWMETEPH